MYIINIGNEKPQSWLPHIIVTTHLLAKAKMCCFIYSLFDKIMYIIANKATFIVRESPNAYIKNNIIPINTTSLSQRFTLLCTVANHICLFSFPITLTIHYFGN